MKSRNRTPLAPSLLAVLLIACGAGAGPTEADPQAGFEPEPVPVQPADPIEDCPKFFAPVEPWRRPVDSASVADDREPHHSAVEPVINAGDPFTLQGKFAYGRLSLDLERETVVAYLREGDCGEWVAVASGETDDVGEVRLPVEQALPVGQHEFRLFVPGDGSFAEGSVWVVERGQQAVVFDIDGTLTTGDREVFQELLLGSTPAMYPAADEVVRAYAAAGYFVVYVTGRPYFLNGVTREWLRARGFPEGPLRTTDRLTQTVPSADGVQAFKRAYLEPLMRGPRLALDTAYGNADTDVCAYAQAGIAPERTWIIGDNGGMACRGYDPSNPVASYPEHLSELERMLAATR